MGELIGAALAAALRAERAAKQMTIVDLADAAGVAERSAIRHLNGQRDITVSVLDRYATALGVRGSDLMREAERREASHAADPTASRVIAGRFGIQSDHDDLALGYDPDLDAVARPRDPDPTDEQ
jgi:transcriptional regulator with XRE-family HTH domain